MSLLILFQGAEQQAGQVIDTTFQTLTLVDLNDPQEIEQSWDRRRLRDLNETATVEVQ